MFPMLRNKKDTVIIKPLTGKLKKYDITLYRKRNLYVLHRIVKVTPGGYIICGDNFINLETDITDEQIIGKMEGFYLCHSTLFFLIFFINNVWDIKLPISCNKIYTKNYLMKSVVLLDKTLPSFQ